MIRETTSLNPTRYLLHLATLLRLGSIANLPNTQKQIPRISQTGKTKKKILKIKGQEKSQEKELSEIKASQLPDMEVKTMVVRMLNKIRKIMDELNWNLTKEIASIIKDIGTIKRTSQK